VTLPVIGITTDYREEERGRYDVPADYVEAVLLGGGAPLLVPPVDDLEAVGALLARVDALLLTGGRDLDPSHYEQAPHPQTRLLHPRRDRFELALARAAVGKGLPMMGICLGAQVLNVALGGSLYQHVPDQVASALAHAPSAAGHRSYHQVRVAPDSALARILGSTELEVNSSHHQAIREVARPLRAVAWSEDGLAEAAEALDGRFLLAIQWHPENLARERSEHRALFTALAQAARLRRG
jgi:putative glutamine amidotransferase